MVTRFKNEFRDDMQQRSWVPAGVLPSAPYSIVSCARKHRVVIHTCRCLQMRQNIRRHASKVDYLPIKVKEVPPRATIVLLQTLFW